MGAIEVRRLGTSGLQVTNICLGTMAFGRWIDQAAASRVLDTGLDAGINFLDTANIYGRFSESGDPTQVGESETILGNLLGPRRQGIILATKVKGSMGAGPFDAGLSRGAILKQVEASLRRLQTDYIDLYQCHQFDPNTPLEETLRAFDDLIHQGKVRYIGCSNFAAWQIAKANGISERLGIARFVSVQPQYSLLKRGIEGELLPFCASEGVGAIVYSPIARGMLAGKYQQGQPAPEGTRAAAGERLLKNLLTDHNFGAVDRFRVLCESWGLPMARVAFAWVLANPTVTSAILGPSKPEHVAEAAAASELRLSPEQMAALNTLTSA